MKKEEKERITKISKTLLSEIKFGDNIPMEEPLSVYWNNAGFKNSLKKVDPIVSKKKEALILVFNDGSCLIPRGSILGIEGVSDWFWHESSHSAD